MADNVNLRAVVLDILTEVFENGQYSNIVINQALTRYLYLDKKERAFIMRLAHGTIENKIYLEYVVNKFSTTPCAKQKPVIRNILIMSVYQILFMEQVPDSAVCNEAVKLAQKRGLNGLKGFVNGVLRTISRNKDNITVDEKDKVKALSIKYSMPEWLTKYWVNEYSYETAEAMLKAFLSEKKTYIRCSMESVGLVRDGLTQAGVQVEDAPYISYALTVSGYNYLGALKEFREGRFTVQDVSSMFVGQIADVKKDDNVIDVCAAPGGKATHIASLLDGSGHVEARDLTEAKIYKIEENISRLKLKNISVKQQDATVYDEQSAESADILICDLPCSGLGVIGRKPDIKYRMTREQMAELSKLQKDILSVVWKYVKPGGRLIFSTCTVNRQENEENAQWIIENLPFEPEDITGRLPEELRQQMKNNYSIQLFPGINDCDGFFISSFKRK